MVSSKAEGVWEKGKACQNHACLAWGWGWGAARVPSFLTLKKAAGYIQNFPEAGPAKQGWVLATMEPGGDSQPRSTTFPSSPPASSLRLICLPHRQDSRMAGRGPLATQLVNLSELSSLQSEWKTIFYSSGSSCPTQ